MCADCLKLLGFTSFYTAGVRLGLAYRVTLILRVLDLLLDFDLDFLALGLLLSARFLIIVLAREIRSLLTRLDFERRYDLTDLLRDLTFLTFLFLDFRERLERPDRTDRADLLRDLVFDLDFLVFFEFLEVVDRASSLALVERAELDRLILFCSICLSIF